MMTATSRQSWFDTSLSLTGTFVACRDATSAWTWTLEIRNSRGVIPTYRVLRTWTGGPVASSVEAESHAYNIWRTERAAVAAARDSIEADESPPEYAVLLRRAGVYYSLALRGIPREIEEALTNYRIQAEIGTDTSKALILVNRDLYDAGAGCVEVLRRLLVQKGADS